MFLKRCPRKKDGKTHLYWALAESVRTVDGPRHRIVTYLGELSPSKKKGWADLVRRLDTVPDAIKQACLFEPVEVDPAEDDVPEHLEVSVRNVRMERKRSFGNVWLAWILWRAMGFDRLLSELLPAGKETASWARSIFVLVAGRLCSPGSERHLSEEWFPRTSPGRIGSPTWLKPKAEM